MPRNVDSVNIRVTRLRKPAPARAYHHGNLREALVDAGLAQLDGEARAQISLRELARGVGVSANAAYRHFADKEALLCAMAAEGFRRLHARQLRAASRRRDPGEKILASGRAYLRFARENPGLFRLMFGQFASAQRSGELQDAGRATLGELRRGVAASAGLAPADARVTVGAVFAWSLAHGLSHLLLDGQIRDVGAEPAAIADAVLTFAARGMRRRT